MLRWTGGSSYRHFHHADQVPHVTKPDGGSRTSILSRPSFLVTESNVFSSLDLRNASTIAVGHSLGVPSSSSSYSAQRSTPLEGGAVPLCQNVRSRCPGYGDVAPSAVVASSKKDNRSRAGGKRARSPGTIGRRSSAPDGGGGGGVDMAALQRGRKGIAMASRANDRAGPAEGTTLPQQHRAPPCAGTGVVAPPTQDPHRTPRELRCFGEGHAAAPKQLPSSFLVASPPSTARTAPVLPPSSLLSPPCPFSSSLLRVCGERIEEGCRLAATPSSPFVLQEDHSQQQNVGLNHSWWLCEREAAEHDRHLDSSHRWGVSPLHSTGGSSTSVAYCGEHSW